MYFKSIELQNFRNYSDLSLDFDPKLNIIFGENAQGKTNLIESLFIMGLGKSFRTNKDQDMIAFGKEFSKAVSVVCDEDEETEIEVIYQKEGKILKVDGVKLQRTVDLLENVYIVVFSPDDLKIIKEGPDNRRKFLDRELCQINPVYYSDLGNYKKVLKQRNYLLKTHNSDEKLFEVFDEALADYGLRLVKERIDFTERLGKISTRIHGEISGGRENLAVSYESKITKQFTKEEYKEKLKENFESDVYKGYTSFGPHKDDICIEVNGTDLRSYGSQGQQRTAALSLKLAEIDLIKQETGKDAVLLLDDVLSELDAGRQKYLVQAMKNVQVFITTASIDEKIRELLPDGKAFLVDKATVEIYNN